MATLYLARRPEDGTLAAVKVIRRDLHDDDSVEKMFLDEALLLERMAHPNIVRTFFPEEHKKQMAWLRAARSTSMRPPPSMPPPR